MKLALALLPMALAATPQTQPNIVIYMTEDLSPRQGFAGDDVAKTPNLDAFAKRAVHLSNVFSVYGVCAPSRSSFTTMRYAFTYGAGNMRSDSYVNMPNGTKYLTVPDPDIRAFPETLRQNGYWTFSGSKCDMQFSDYNCNTAPQSIWNSIGNEHEPFWRKKPKGDTRPFMGHLGDQVTHESKIFPNSKHPDVVNKSEVAKRVVIPPFYKDTETMRNDLASWYNNIAIMDDHFGTVVQNLEDDGLMDDTIVIWMSDHGDGLPRGKRDLFDMGTHVPCLVHIPERFQPKEWPAAGSKLDSLVSFLDFGPSLLELAGLEVPKGVHGRSLFSSEPRDYVFGAKDRMDEAIDYVRYARTKTGYKLIRNFLPEIPAGGRCSYRFQQAGASELRDLFHNGSLNEVQARWFSPRHPEEFYDVNKDPYELNNLINSTDAEYQQILADLRAALDKELDDVGPDFGNIDEAIIAERFWPGGEQPVTADPVVKVDADSKVLSLTQSEGSSILYSLQGCGQDDEWYVYASPVPLGSCTGVQAKAQRYGWAVSSTVSQDSVLLV